MKKRRLRYDRIFILIGFILLIIVICFLLFRNDSNKASSKEVKMPLVVNKNISSIDDLVKNSELILEKVYEYSDELEKDFIISQSITEGETVNKGDKLVITVSLGKLDKEKLAQDNINELGRVPVMMYHGIVNKKSSETSYTGGNVDKDGYNRTVEAFKEDLEFYYQNGYRMIRAIDYVNGIIDVPYGKSPIVLTFDDGSANNIKVNGISEDGEIIIDENSAVGVLESFKKKYPDFNVTATFFVNGSLFQQSEYNEKILKWLVENGYDIGNHTKTHVNFSNASTNESEEEVGFVYNKLDAIIPDKYVKLVALPFGSPYKKTHANFSHIINSNYNGINYETVSTFRVGWMPDYSPFSKDFDKEFIMRVRAYDNNGVDFDIEASFRILEKNRYVSDGNVDTIVIKESDASYINDTNLKVISY
ncbi:MAG: polysaccharide deacetylase family protein [Bacilli bacterium]